MTDPNQFPPPPNGNPYAAAPNTPPNSPANTPAPYGQPAPEQAAFGQAPYGQPPQQPAPYGQAPNGQPPYGQPQNTPSENYPSPYQEVTTENKFAKQSIIFGAIALVSLATIFMGFTIKWTIVLAAVGLISGVIGLFKSFSVRTGAIFAIVGMLMSAASGFIMFLASFPETGQNIWPQFYHLSALQPSDQDRVKLTRDIEREIDSSLQQEGIPGTSDCPDDLVFAKDVKFTCTISFDDGSTGEIDLVFLGLENDEFVFDLAY